MDDESVSIDALMELNQYKIIILDSHGGYSSLTYSFCTGEKYSENLWNDYKDKYPDIIQSRYIGNSLVKDKKYFSIRDEFFEKAYPDNSFNNALMYVGACQGAESEYFINILADKGIKTVFAYSSVVGLVYNQNMCETIFKALSEGKTAREAYNLAQSEHGMFDETLNFRRWVQDLFNISPSTVKAQLHLFGDGMFQLGEEIVPSFAGGQGTINDPYQIATAEQLDAVRYNLKSNFVLVNDIDLSEYENWVPIGGIKDVEAKDGFQGTFDGKGHTIKNLKMDYSIKNEEESKYCSYSFGFFSDTTLCSGIKNINFEDVNISLNDSSEELMSKINVGSISAQASSISDCKVSGKIEVWSTNEINVGGISCEANSITGCKNTIDISTESESFIFIGGISKESQIKDCVNKGNINCMSMVAVMCGGITPFGEVLDESEIINCKNFGDIKISGRPDITIGGIIGSLSDGTILNCINYGNIQVETYDIYNTNDQSAEIGGIVGRAGSYNNHDSKIENCVNFGNIESMSATEITSIYEFSKIGGILGRVNFGEKRTFITNCYNVNSTMVGDLHEGGTPFIGRIRGYFDNVDTTMSNNYSINTTTLNGSIPIENIAPDKANGGSMTKAEIEKAIQDLGFELPSELPATS